MHPLIKRLEKVANILIIILIAILLIALSRRYIFSSNEHNLESSEIENRIRDSADLSPLGLEWGKSKKTLVLVVAPNCQYCSESATFYQKISEGLSNREDTRLVAVLPKNGSESKNHTESEKYLNEIGFAAEEIKEIPLSLIGVSVTPTLISVNEKGEIEDIVTGRVKADRESEVLDRLGIDKPAYVSRNSSVLAAAANATLANNNNQSSNKSDRSLERINAPELINAIQADPQITIVDLRDRKNFAEEHIRGAKNIPIDEIAARVRELPPSKKIVLYCNCYQDDISRLAAQILKERGFQYLAILTGGIHIWQQNGLPVVKNSRENDPSQ